MATNYFMIGSDYIGLQDAPSQKYPIPASVNDVLEYLQDLARKWGGQFYQRVQWVGYDVIFADGKQTILVFSELSRITDVRCTLRVSYQPGYEWFALLLLGDLGAAFGTDWHADIMQKYHNMPPLFHWHRTEPHENQHGESVWGEGFQPGPPPGWQPATPQEAKRDEHKKEIVFPVSDKPEKFILWLIETVYPDTPNMPPAHRYARGVQISQLLSNTAASGYFLERFETKNNSIISVLATPAESTQVPGIEQTTAKISYANDDDDVFFGAFLKIIAQHYPESGSPIDNYLQEHGLGEKAKTVLNGSWAGNWQSPASQEPAIKNVMVINISGDVTGNIINGNNNTGVNIVQRKKKV